MRQRKGFEALKKEWYRRLRDSGFEDIETEIKGEYILKQNSSNSYRQATAPEREAKERYYSLLGQKFNQTEFDNEVDFCVMGSYADGLKIKEIVEVLESHGIPRHRQTIRGIIRRWEKKWGLKNWTKKQINPNHRTRS